MAHNTINISIQNVTLASAQRAVAGNANGYFAVVAFYAASNESGANPPSTGLTIQFDDRLTLVGEDEDWVFNSRIYNPAGQALRNRGRSAITQRVLDPENKIYFVSTASELEGFNDGYLYFAMVQFPADVEVGDVYDIEILTGTNPITSEDYEFLYKYDSDEDETWTKEHGIINGSITIVE